MPEAQLARARKTLPEGYKYNSDSLTPLCSVCNKTLLLEDGYWKWMFYSTTMMFCEPCCKGVVGAK